MVEWLTGRDQETFGGQCLLCEPRWWWQSSRADRKGGFRFPSKLIFANIVAARKWPAFVCTPLIEFEYSSSGFDREKIHDTHLVVVVLVWHFPTTLPDQKIYMFKLHAMNRVNIHSPPPWICVIPFFILIIIPVTFINSQMLVWLLLLYGDLLRLPFSWGPDCLEWMAWINRKKSFLTIINNSNHALVQLSEQRAALNSKSLTSSSSEN